MNAAERVEIEALAIVRMEAVENRENEALKNVGMEAVKCSNESRG